ncbi:MAG TPA: hypothetical protein PKE55_13525, partial [Kiritimatiellia bacterium]|nr:hypothetical protein [Kiritimatiellia bacterium]
LDPTPPGPDLHVAVASDEAAEWCRHALDRQPESRRPRHLHFLTGKTRDILRHARAAWVASGTATLETALLDCPMIVVYRTAWLTYEVGRRLIKVPHLGMVNLIAGKEACPELLQHDATGPNLATAILPLLDDTPQRATMLTDLARVRDLLGEGGAARNAAAIIQHELTAPARSPS